MFGRKQDDDTTAQQREEPRTAPEVQRWLRQRGYGEWTEDNARHLLFMRELVRDGRVSDG